MNKAPTDIRVPWPSPMEKLKMDEMDACGIVIDAKDPRQRIEAIEHLIEGICEASGTGPSDGVMVLLVAAVDITMRHTSLSGTELADLMAEGLAMAIDSAEVYRAGGGAKAGVH